MSKERELLKRALGALDGGPLYRVRLQEEIRNFLDNEKPEKREPISDEEIYREMSMNCSGRYYDAFCDGVRFAEKHHGIKEEEMCEESKRVWVARVYSRRHSR